MCGKPDNCSGIREIESGSGMHRQREDEMPIMKHEKTSNAFTDSDMVGVDIEAGGRVGNSAAVKNYHADRRSSASGKLTVISIVVFISAIVFLIVFLIVPIFYSLSHPSNAGPESHKHEHESSGHSMEGGHGGGEHGGDVDDHGDHGGNGGGVDKMEPGMSAIRQLVVRFI